MTTTYDIIDTAVKVGLGALIIGITTYFISRRNYKHEINKDLINDKRNILIELSKHIDMAGQLRNKVVLSADLKNGSNGDAKKIYSEEYGYICDAVSEMRQAVSKSYLIGDDQLSVVTKELFDAFNKYEEYVLSENGFSKTDDYIKIENDMKEAKLKILNKYKQVLETIYA